MRPLTRRDFLRAGGAAALGLVAATCTRGNGGGGDGPATLNDVIGDRTQTLSVLNAGFETFTGSPQRVVFGLRNPATGDFFQGGTARVYAAQERDDAPIGPIEATFRGEGLGNRGVYVTDMTFPAEGPWILVVEYTSASGEELIGAANHQVGQVTNMPKPGDEAVSVATPTFERARGVDPICTLEPPCSMHAISLDAALANDKPTVLIIATPRFCSSALCGPEVEIVDEVSQARGDEANFVHIELLRDDSDETTARWAQNPTPELFSPGAAAWRVEQEPAIYFIDADGTIQRRIIGPFDRTEAQQVTSDLIGA